MKGIYMEKMFANISEDTICEYAQETQHELQAHEPFSMLETLCNKSTQRAGEIVREQNITKYEQSSHERFGLLEGLAQCSRVFIPAEHTGERSDSFYCSTCRRS